MGRVKTQRAQSHTAAPSTIERGLNFICSTLDVCLTFFFSTNREILGLLQNGEDCYLGNEHDQACVFLISLFAAVTLGEDKFHNKVK